MTHQTTIARLATNRGEGMSTHCSRTAMLVQAAYTYARLSGFTYLTALAVVQARTDNRKDA